MKFQIKLLKWKCENEKKKWKWNCNLKELEQTNHGVIILVDIYLFYFGGGTTVSCELYIQKKKRKLKHYLEKNLLQMSAQEM